MRAVKAFALLCFVDAIGILTSMNLATLLGEPYVSTVFSTNSLLVFFVGWDWAWRMTAPKG